MNGISYAIFVVSVMGCAVLGWWAKRRGHEEPAPPTAKEVRTILSLDLTHVPRDWAPGQVVWWADDLWVIQSISLSKIHAQRWQGRHPLPRGTVVHYPNEDRR